jgi:hypothetical protein
MPRAIKTPAEPGRTAVVAPPRQRTDGAAGEAGREAAPQPKDDEDLRDVPAELWRLMTALAKTPEVELDAAFPEPEERPADAPAAPRQHLHRPRRRGWR